MSDPVIDTMVQAYDKGRKIVELSQQITDSNEELGFSLLWALAIVHVSSVGTDASVNDALGRSVVAIVEEMQRIIKNKVVH